MAQDQSNYLFNIQAGTSGIPAAIRQMELLQKAIAKTTAMSQGAILGPTGQPAGAYLARQTPGFLRSAEQNVLMRSGAGPQLYVPSNFTGPRIRTTPTPQSQLLLQSQRAQQALLTYNPIPPTGMGNLPGPINFDVERQTDDEIRAAMAKGLKQPYAPPPIDKENLTAASSAYKDLNSQLKAGLLTHNEYNNALKNLNNEFGTNYKSVENSTLAMIKLAARATLVIPIWMALRSAYMALLNAIGQGINFWKEYESTLAEVGIASNATTDQLQLLGESVLTFSTIYGISASKALEAAKIFAQQGLTIKETIDMTRVSMIGAQVLGEDVTTVAESLTAAVRAYNIPMQESISIVDKWMNVQKEFAVTSKDLAEGMKTAGATASAFGISVDEFNGHMTAMIEVTRKSGSEAGNALQMIYTRLLTTARPAIQTIAEVPVFQDETGKAVMETTNIFRNANDVLDDLATAWVGLSEAEKIELATQVGSRRQATPFIALMENYNRGLLAQITSLTAAGTALKAYEQKQDTVAVKMTQMQNAWLQLAQTVSQTEPWKKAIDWVGKLAEKMMLLINRTAYYQQMRLKDVTEGITKLDIEDARAKAYEKLIELEKEFSKPGKDPVFLEKIKKGIAELTVTPIKPLEVRVVTREILEARQQLVDLKAQLDTVAEKKSAIAFSGLLGSKEQMKAFQDLLVEENKIYIEINKRKGIIDSDKIEADADAKSKDDADKLIKENEERDKKLEENEKQLVQRVTQRSNVLKALGYTEEQILAYQLSQYETAKGIIDEEVRQLKLVDLRADSELVVLNRIKEQKDIMGDMFATGFNNLFETGGGFFSAVNEGLVKSFRDVFSQGLGDLVNATGIGDIFGTSIVQIQNLFTGLKGKIENAHILGITEGAKLIIRAHQVGMSNGSIDLQNELAYGIAGGKIGPSTQKAFNTLTQSGIVGWGGSSITDNGMFNPTSYGLSQGYRPGPVSGYSTLNYGVSGGRIGPARKGQGSGGNILGGATQGALLGYSAYQSARAGGVNQGTSIASGVLTGVGGAGVLLGVGGIGGIGAAMGAASAAGAGMMGTIGAGLAAIGPVGWIALGVLAVGTALGMFGGRSKQETTDSRTTENRVSSRIDITNKNLEIINRNLLGLKSAIETYMLPASAYFSEKRGLEDNFSLHMRRGLN